MNESELMAKSVANHAIASFGKREANRSLLSDGSNHVVDLRVKGNVGAVKVSFPIRGTLTVGIENPTGSTSRPNVKMLLGLALDLMPKTKRKLFFSMANRECDVEEGTSSAVEALLIELSEKRPSAGPVRFIAKS